MAGTNQKLTAAVEEYFADLRRIRSSGGATGERSYYPPLTNLLNAVGTTLKPKVFCVSELAHQGAGHPDLGLYAAKQMQRGRQRERQLPALSPNLAKPLLCRWKNTEPLAVSSSFDQGLTCLRHVLRFLKLSMDQYPKQFRVQNSVNRASVTDLETCAMLRIVESGPRCLHGADPLLLIYDELAQRPPATAGVASPSTCDP